MGNLPSFDHGKYWYPNMAPDQWAQTSAPARRLGEAPAGPGKEDWEDWGDLSPTLWGVEQEITTWAVGFQS